MVCPKRIIIFVLLFVCGIFNPAFALEPFYPNIPWGVAPEDVRLYYGDLQPEKLDTDVGLVLHYAAGATSNDNDLYYYFTNDDLTPILYHVTVNTEMYELTLKEHDATAADFLRALTPVVYGTQAVRYYYEESALPHNEMKRCRHMFWVNRTLIEFVFVWEKGGVNGKPVSVFSLAFFDTEHEDFKAYSETIKDFAWQNLE